MEIRDIPIHLVFQNTATQSLENLNLIERITRESLKSTPGSVGIFIEAADITTTEANFFQSQIQRGVLPSDSFFTTVARRYPRLLRGMLFLLHRSDYLLFHPDGFRSQQLRLLDTLSQNYPEQIVPILEHSTSSEVNVNRFADMLQTNILDLNRNLAPNPYYSTTSFLVDRLRQDRQVKIAEIIQETVAETNIACLVGHLFITNHRVGIHLERAGFSAVNRYFPSA